MTSHLKGHKMRPQREKKKPTPKGKRKPDNVAVPKNLPLSKKSIYIDMKQGKPAELMEEQLKKLGAKIETFLSSEVNYVVSSFGPSKAEDTPKCLDENPQSPATSVASPFSCIPSPSAPNTVETKKSTVSRGKALAHLACSKNLTSTVVANAEKMGVKVISVDAAKKWMDKELKKFEQDSNLKNIKQEPGSPKKPSSPKKERKTKSKVLKGCYIKFEASNRHYRPVKSEMEKWPRVNTLAPPGLCPFVDSKAKAKQSLVVHRAQAGLAVPNIPSKAKSVNKPAHVHPGESDCEFNRPSPVQSLDSKSVASVPSIKPVPPELVATPITTAGDIKRNRFKKNLAINKQQGYCDCCDVKFKSLDKHLKGDEHQAFARNKSNYESLDALLNEIPSTVKFLETVLLNHCKLQRKKLGLNDRPEKAPNPLDVVEPISPLPEDNNGVVSLSLNPPQLCHTEMSLSKDRHLLMGTDTDFASQSQVETPTQGEHTPGTTPNTTAKAGAEEGQSDQRPQAVVIRRPVPSGIFTSPRRPRPPTPNKTPRMMERSMVFCDSPIASLQPSPCSNSPPFTSSFATTTTTTGNTIISPLCGSPRNKRGLGDGRSLVRVGDFSKLLPGAELSLSGTNNFVSVGRVGKEMVNESVNDDLEGRDTTSASDTQHQSKVRSRSSNLKRDVVRRLTMEDVKPADHASDSDKSLLQKRELSFSVEKLNQSNINTPRKSLRSSMNKGSSPLKTKPCGNKISELEKTDKTTTTEENNVSDKNEKGIATQEDFKHVTSQQNIEEDCVGARTRNIKGVKYKGDRTLENVDDLSPQRKESLNLIKCRVVLSRLELKNLSNTNADNGQDERKCSDVEDAIGQNLDETEKEGKLMQIETVRDKLRKNTTASPRKLKSDQDKTTVKNDNVGSPKRHLSLENVSSLPSKDDKEMEAASVNLRSRKASNKMAHDESRLAEVGISVEGPEVGLMSVDVTNTVRSEDGVTKVIPEDEESGSVDNLSLSCTTRSKVRQSVVKQYPMQQNNTEAFTGAQSNNETVKEKGKESLELLKTGELSYTTVQNVRCDGDAQLMSEFIPSEAVEVPTAPEHCEDKKPTRVDKSKLSMSCDVGKDFHNEKDIANRSTHVTQAEAVIGDYIGGHNVHDTREHDVQPDEEKVSKVTRSRSKAREANKHSEVLKEGNKDYEHLVPQISIPKVEPKIDSSQSSKPEEGNVVLLDLESREPEIRKRTRSRSSPRKTSASIGKLEVKKDSCGQPMSQSADVEVSPNAGTSQNPKFAITKSVAQAHCEAEKAMRGPAVSGVRHDEQNNLLTPKRTRSGSVRKTCVEKVKERLELGKSDDVKSVTQSVGMEILSDADLRQHSQPVVTNDDGQNDCESKQTLPTVQLADKSLKASDVENPECTTRRRHRSSPRKTNTVSDRLENREDWANLDVNLHTNSDVLDEYTKVEESTLDLKRQDPTPSKAEFTTVENLEKEVQPSDMEKPKRTRSSPRKTNMCQEKLGDKKALSAKRKVFSNAESNPKPGYTENSLCENKESENRMTGNEVETENIFTSDCTLQTNPPQKSKEVNVAEEFGVPCANPAESGETEILPRTRSRSINRNTSACSAHLKSEKEQVNHVSSKAPDADNKVTKVVASVTDTSQHPKCALETVKDENGGQLSSADLYQPDSSIEPSKEIQLVNLEKPKETKRQSRGRRASSCPYESESETVPTDTVRTEEETVAGDTTADCGVSRDMSLDANTSQDAESVVTRIGNDNVESVENADERQVNSSPEPPKCESKSQQCVKEDFKRKRNRSGLGHSNTCSGRLKKGKDGCVRTMSCDDNGMLPNIDTSQLLKHTSAEFEIENAKSLEITEIEQMNMTCLQKNNFKDSMCNEKDYNFDGKGTETHKIQQGKEQMKSEACVDEEKDNAQSMEEPSKNHSGRNSRFCKQFTYQGLYANSGLGMEFFQPVIPNIADRVKSRVRAAHCSEQGNEGGVHEYCQNSKGKKARNNKFVKARRRLKENQEDVASNSSSLKDSMLVSICNTKEEKNRENVHDENVSSVYEIEVSKQCRISRSRRERSAAVESQDGDVKDGHNEEVHCTTVVPNKVERLKRRRGDADSDCEDNDRVLPDIADCVKRRRKEKDCDNEKRVVSQIKNAVKKGRGEKNKMVEGCEKVPESVRRRRSCTLFNHPGLYVDRGENSDSDDVIEHDLEPRRSHSRSRRVSMEKSKFIMAVSENRVEHNDATKSTKLCDVSEEEVKIESKLDPSCASDDSLQPSSRENDLAEQECLINIPQTRENAKPNSAVTIQDSLTAIPQNLESTKSNSAEIIEDDLKTKQETMENTRSNSAVEIQDDLKTKQQTTENTKSNSVAEIQDDLKTNPPTRENTRSKSDVKTRDGLKSSSNAKENNKPNSAVVIRRWKTSASLLYLQKQRADWSQSAETKENSSETESETCDSNKGKDSDMHQPFAGFHGDSSHMTSDSCLDRGITDSNADVEESHSLSLQGKDKLPPKPESVVVRRRHQRLSLPLHTKRLRQSMPSLHDGNSSSKAEKPKFGSPKIKLKFKRLPSNEGYSSSILEEYYDEDQQSLTNDMTSCFQQENSETNKMHEPEKANSECCTPRKEYDTDSVDLLLSSPLERRKTVVTNVLKQVEYESKSNETTSKESIKALSNETEVVTSKSRQTISMSEYSVRSPRREEYAKSDKRSKERNQMPIKNGETVSDEIKTNGQNSRNKISLSEYKTKSSKDIKYADTYLGKNQPPEKRDKNKTQLYVHKSKSKTVSSSESKPMLSKQSSANEITSCFQQENNKRHNSKKANSKCCMPRKEYDTSSVDLLLSSPLERNKTVNTNVLGQKEYESNSNETNSLVSTDAVNTETSSNKTELVTSKGKEKLASSEYIASSSRRKECVKNNKRSKELDQKPIKSVETDSAKIQINSSKSRSTVSLSEYKTRSPKNQPSDKSDKNRKELYCNKSRSKILSSSQSKTILSKQTDNKINFDLGDDKSVGKSLGVSSKADVESPINRCKVTLSDYKSRTPNGSESASESSENRTRVNFGRADVDSPKSRQKISLSDYKSRTPNGSESASQSSEKSSGNYGKTVIESPTNTRKITLSDYKSRTSNESESGSQSSEKSSKVSERESGDSLKSRQKISLSDYKSRTPNESESGSQSSENSSKVPSKGSSDSPNCRRKITLSDYKSRTPNKSESASQSSEKSSENSGKANIDSPTNRRKITLSEYKSRTPNKAPSQNNQTISNKADVESPGSRPKISLAQYRVRSILSCIDTSPIKQDVSDTVSLIPAGLKTKQQRKTEKPKEKQKKEKASKRRRNSSGCSSPGKRKKVKLSGSWRLASVRSMTQLVASEHEGSVSSFHGFHESSDRGLPSDVSFVNETEVELKGLDAENWVLDEDTDIIGVLNAKKRDVLNKGEKIVDPIYKEDNDNNDYMEFVPTFSSPDKATDSSWGDVCESYLSKSVGKQSSCGTSDMQLKSPRRMVHKRLFTSPVKRIQEIMSPNRQAFQQRQEWATPPKIDGNSINQGTSKTMNDTIRRAGFRTPTKTANHSKRDQSPVVRVDNVVSFNLMSPQKLKPSPFKISS